MSATKTILTGVVHGRTIDLEQEAGLPDGEKVSVIIERLQPVVGMPDWLERFDVESSVTPGNLVLKGTRLVAEELVRLLEEGRTDEELQRLHPELSAEDLTAIHQYALVPLGLRRSIGGWAEDGDELDDYLELTRRERKIGRRVIEE